MTPESGYESSVENDRLDSVLKVVRVRFRHTEASMGGVKKDRVVRSGRRVVSCIVIEMVNMFTNYLYSSNINIGL